MIKPTLGKSFCESLTKYCTQSIQQGPRGLGKAPDPELKSCLSVTKPPTSLSSFLQAGRDPLRTLIWGERGRHEEGAGKDASDSEEKRGREEKRICLSEFLSKGQNGVCDPL